MTRPSASQPAPWQTGKPPNETLVEVRDNDGRIMRVRAFWGRRGYLPHWESEDGGTDWSPDAFTEWRELAADGAL